MSEMPIRVAVVSRNHLIRAGLVNLIGQLEARAVVTEASGVDDALQPHDVAIYDLGAVSGADAYNDLRRLLDEGIQVIGLVYDVHDTVPASAEAVSHIITLSVTPEQLLEVLVRTTPARPTGSSIHGADSLPSELTEQEFRVLELIGAGLSNDQIAKELYLSVNSIKTYIRTAYRKIGAINRSDAMRWTHRHGLAGGPDRR